MSARITLHCDTLWRYSACTSQLITDALTLVQARQAGRARGWRPHPDGTDYCPNCSGTHRQRPGAHVVHLHPARKDQAMPEPTEPDELTGAYGSAVRIPHASYPEALATLDAWIITAPVWHPLWSQYLLSLVTLADVPGMPSAEKESPDVTHQVIVMTLNPEHGPYDARHLVGDDLRFLTPGNIGQQFTATEDQARRLAALCVRAVVDGVLIPETADAPDRIRSAWRRSIAQTLDHDRDPHHGHQN